MQDFRISNYGILTERGRAAQYSKANRHTYSILLKDFPWPQTYWTI